MVCVVGASPDVRGEGHRPHVLRLAHHHLLREREYVCIYIVYEYIYIINSNMYVWHRLDIAKAVRRAEKITDLLFTSR